MVYLAWVLLATLNQVSWAREPNQAVLGAEFHGISKRRRSTALSTCHRYENFDQITHEYPLEEYSDEEGSWHELMNVENTYSTFWSYRPRCIQNDDASKTYCVYTSTTFARNRGISFFTTPENAERIISLPAFNDPKVLEGTDEYSNPPYEARELPGRGIGLIANRTLNRGDLVFRSTPVFVVEEESFEEVPDNLRHAMERYAVESLPPETRELYMDLCAHFGGEKVEDIINTNAFALELLGEHMKDTDIGFNGVLPEISRLNHACRPNTQYHFNPLTFIQTVYAVRTIPIGEEISNSYIDPVQRHANRQAALMKSWGFKCTCAHCSLDDPLANASDARIATISRWRRSLLSRAPHPPLAIAGLDMARLLISLYEQEMLHAPIADAYVLAALEAMGVGNEVEGQRWAHLAVERGILYGGGDDEDVKKMRKLLQEGRGHWSWMFREKGLGKAEASGELGDDRKKKQENDEEVDHKGD